MNFFVNVSITIFLLVNLPWIDALRILGIFPMQMHSHNIMCQELMRGLAAKGHQVDVYSHFPLDKPVPNYKDYSLRGTLPELTNNLTYEMLKHISTPSSFINNVLEPVTKSLCELLNHPYFKKLLRDPPKNPAYDLIILEFSQSHCYIPWSRHLKIPIIGVITLPILDMIHDPLGNPLSLATEPSIFSAYAAPMNFYQRLINVYNYYINTFTFNRMARRQDKYVKDYFGPDYPNNLELVKDFSLILINHHSSMNGKRIFAPSIVPVGGLHVVDHNETLPKEVQTWLDESSAGCIYMSFGSMVRLETLPVHILEVLYKSFQNITPTRILLRVSKPEVLPNGLPSNVMTQPWLPQIQVLKHKNIKAFITHGGLMGSQEAMYYGVPLIATPLFGDQPFNVAHFVKKKIAISFDLKTITVESFTHTMKQVLENPIYKKTAKRLSEEFKDRPMPPMDTAIYWIEYISRRGKDALRSPSVDMPWWQAALIDVYSVIMVFVILIVYVIFRVCTKLIVRSKQTREKMKTS